MHLSEATAENYNSPQTNNQQPSTGDNKNNANDTSHSFGDETTPPHRNLSLIEAFSTEQPELNTSVGPSQSTPVQVMERQKYHHLSVKLLLTKKNEEFVLLTKTIGQLIKEKHVVVEHSCFSEKNGLRKINPMMKNSELDSLNVVRTRSRNFEKKSNNIFFNLIPLIRKNV